MKQYIDKDIIKAEIERRKEFWYSKRALAPAPYAETECKKILSFIDTLDVKEVDITSMADEYYDALIKEAEMDVDMAGHCRLAYYNGCRDVLNKIQKGE